MKKDIIFVHGWGEDSRIWDRLAECLPEYNHHFIDLGFIGEEGCSKKETKLPECGKAVFITHSLGTLWALNHTPLPKISAFIAINGFGRFTDFATNETLKIMAKSLQRNKILQMEMFWKNCNFPKNMQQIYKPVLNESVLSQGLKWLGSWDHCEKLQELRTQGISVLSLGGEKDKILPPQIMREHWKNLKIDLVMNEQAGHALPLSHPHWCARQVQETLG